MSEINGNKIIGSYTANSSAKIFGGTVITMIVFGNRTSNTVTNLKIGTTDGGADIYSKASVTPFEVLVLNSQSLSKQFFNISQDTPIYITAANWNGAILGMTIFFESIID